MLQYAELLKIQKRLGRENFPLIEQTYYQNHEEMVCNFDFFGSMFALLFFLSCYIYDWWILNNKNRTLWTTGKTKKYNLLFIFDEFPP